MEVQRGSFPCFSVRQSNMVPFPFIHLCDLPLLQRGHWLGISSVANHPDTLSFCFQGGRRNPLSKIQPIPRAQTFLTCVQGAEAGKQKACSDHHPMGVAFIPTNIFRFAGHTLRLGYYRYMLTALQSSTVPLFLDQIRKKETKTMV